MRASNLGQKELVELLLNAGADKHAKNNVSDVVYILSFTVCNPICVQRLERMQPISLNFHKSKL